MNRQIVHVISEIVNFRHITHMDASANMPAFIENTVLTVWKVPCIHQNRLARISHQVSVQRDWGAEIGQV